MTTRRKIVTATTIALAAAPLAIAGDGFSHFDVYATHPAVEYVGVAGGGSGGGGPAPPPRVSEVDDEGDGIAMKGAWLVTEHLFFSGELERAELDDSGLDLEQERLGVGARMALTDDAAATGRLEYVDLEYDVPYGTRSEDGVGAHASMRVSATERLRGYAQAGLLELSGCDGEQYTVGASFTLEPEVALFAEYRAIRLDRESGDGRLDIDDIRVGLRFFLDD